MIAQVPYTVEFSVLDGADDAEEAVGSGGMNLTSSDLEMVMEGTEQVIGIRFNGVNIPQGATINSAFIQFTADETDDVATTLNIVGELVEHSAAFSTTNFDISDRPTTTAIVNWDDIPAWDMVGEAGPDQATPDLTAIVDEILGQPGWSAGNAMTFVITGSGKRVAHSFNNGANAPPKLVINYDVVEFPTEPLPVATASLWKYDDSGQDLGTAWQEPAFDDSAWDFGQAQLGYGDSDEATALDFGGDPDNKIITYYFRKVVDVPDASIYDGLTMELLADDGAVVYLNGEEIARKNMPAGPIDYLTQASSVISGADEDTYETFSLPNTLVNGENIIAVEIHQVDGVSSDISFDLSLSGDIILPPAVQFIHNSPDPDLVLAEVWVNPFNLLGWQNFTGSTPFPFRSGSSYITDLPAGTHSIAVSAFGQGDYLWNATEFTIEQNKRYIVMVSGVRDTTLFNTSVNGGEAIQFKIQVNEVPGNESVSANETLPLLFHGTPDLPNMRLIAPGAGDATGDLPEGLPYAFDLVGGTVDALPYPIVQVTNNLTTEIYGEYKADLVPFSQQVITIFTSGFYSADGNTGINDPNFGLFIMPPTEGFAIPLPAPDPAQPGKVQIIHNSPDPELAEVDVWLNGAKAVEALGFREATAFVDIPAGMNRVAIAPHSTTDADTAWSAVDVMVEADLDINSFQLVGRNYTAVAFGARNTAPFENAVNPDVSFGIAFEEGRVEAANDTVVDLRFFHGATNAPMVDGILEGEIVPIVNDLTFGNYSPIYVTLPAEETFQVNLTDAIDNNEVLLGYNLDLTGLGGQAFVVLASGLFNDQPGFGLYVVDEDGGDAVPLELVFGSNVEDLKAAGVEVFPNPVIDKLTISSPKMINQLRVLDINGRVLYSIEQIDGQFTIDMTAFETGVYLLEMDIEGIRGVMPVVKQ